VSAATDQDTYTVTAVLSAQDPVLSSRFDISGEEASHDLNIVVELDQAVPVKPVEHHFLIDVDCPGCGGILRQMRFASFPTGSNGNFVFHIRREEIKTGTVAATLQVVLKMRFAEHAATLSVPVRVCLRPAPANRCRQG